MWVMTLYHCLPPPVSLPAPHAQIAGHLDATRSPVEALGRMLSKHQRGSRDKITMSGPAGVGQADVAVKLANNGVAKQPSGVAGGGGGGGR